MKTRPALGNSTNLIVAAGLLCCGLLLAVLGGGESLVSGGKRSILPAPTSAQTPPSKDASRWANAYGKLPLSFEENQGQTAREVRYLSHGRGFELFLTPEAAVLALNPRKHLDFSPAHRSATIRALREKGNSPAAQTQLTALRFQLEGANPNPQMNGLDRLPTRVNYFTGNDPRNWKTNVPSFSRVKYSEVYRGIDLVFYGNQRKLEYDFIVAPGADPSQISLQVAGTSKIRLNAHGDLALNVPGGQVELQRPVVYQMVKGARHEIEGAYVLRHGNRVAFQVASYDRSEPLILDPVLLYSTYLGGSATEDFTPAAAIAVDSSGNAFLAGQTTSTDFPAGTKGAVITPPVANAGASFVAELDPTGANLLYSTYLAGSTTNAGDSAFGIAVDSTGKVYVTGQTFATDFPPTANAFNPGPVSATAAAAGTVYLTKLDPTVNGAAALLYSTYLSGTGGEFGNCIAVDSAGNAYVGGQTFSTDFPTPAAANPLQTTPSNASGTGFVSRIDTTKSGAASLIFSTYFGGNGANAASTGGLGYGDQILGIAADSSQNVYVAGATTSTDSPASFITSATAFQAAPPAGNTQGSVFVSKISTTAGTLAYSTYLAGNAGAGTAGDQALALALGPGNVAYVTGKAASADFPVISATAYDSTNSGPGKSFISLVDTTKSGNSSLKYSTFLGGSAGDFGNGIAADSSGIAYVVGTTASSDFAGVGTLSALGALQTSLLNSSGDPFVAKLNPAVAGKSGLLYATYYGGSGDGGDADQGFGIALDSANPPNAYITGETFSTDLPVVSAFQSKLNGNGNPAAGISDAFVARLNLIPALVVAPTSFNFGTLGVGVASTAQSFTVTNNTASAATFNSITTTGVSPAANTDFAISSDGCGLSLAAGAPPCAVKVIFTPSVAAAESATLVINATITNGGQNSTEVFNVNLRGTGTNSFPAVTLDHANVAFNPQMVTTTSAATTVNLKNTGTGALTINAGGITTTGDFGQTNNCPVGPQTLAAGSSCAIQVTFAPTATGARNGTLSIADNAAGSPQSIPLTGTGWDFSLSGPTTTQTATPKAAAKFSVTMTPLGGFNQFVALTCTASTPATTCSAVSPVSAADGTTPQQSLVTVSTSAMTVPPTFIPNLPLRLRRVVPLILLLALLFLLPRTRRLQVRLGLVAVLLALITIVACGTSTSKGSITITGQSTGSAGSVSHSITVPLTIH